MSHHYQTHPSPVGILHLIASDTHLLKILYENMAPDAEAQSQLILQTNPILDATKRQLDEYFARQRQQFDLPISFSGTDFQKASWNALLDIPYGETRSYAAQAESINKPKAYRAVGSANGQNPISIVVPCHRVIGKSGKLAGYGGGLDRKQFLLDLESGQVSI